MVSSADISPCFHEEADTRLFIHIKNAVLSGHKFVLLSTVDSDVIVIATSMFQTLKEFGLQDLFVEYGVGKNRSLIQISKLTSKISPDMRNALTFFHAFTGCDSVSSFYGEGKTKAWSIWNKLENDLTGTFLRLSSCNEISNNDFEKIQLFTIFIYDSSSQAKSVNECRRVLYTQKNRSVETFLPLRKHCASICGEQCSILTFGSIAWS